MELAGLCVLIIGIGKTGAATAGFFSQRGAKVMLTDEKAPSELAETLDQLRKDGVNFRFLPFATDALRDADMVIPSPGVPPFNALLVAALQRKQPVISELELAYRFLKPPMIAITGTNGKTTTTTLVGEILKKSGMSVFVGGNIGTPLIDYVKGAQPDDYAVVEVSSFQLQWIRDFCPDIAVLLNVTRDHIDYHGSFAEYRSVKERIFVNQTGRNLAVLNADEEDTVALSRRLKSEVFLLSSSRRLAKGIYLAPGRIVYHPPVGDVETYPLDMVKIPGIHNLENIMAAIAAAKRAGCGRKDIISAVEDFHGIDHRIEFAGSKNGVDFYDDSKATNVGAVLRALESFSRPVVLLLGGRDKQGDFENLAPMIKRKVKTMILFGEARGIIDKLIGGIVETHQAATLKEAMPLARRHAVAGDVVLLAPGCASFDEFKDYKERGEIFKKWVGNLP